MIKVYDSQGQFLFLLDSLKNWQIVESLEKGYKTMQFDVPCNRLNLESFVEENYVETSDYRYVIKEVRVERNDFFTVYCNPDIEDLVGLNFEVFDLFELSLENGYNYCLSQAPSWNCEYNSQNSTQITYQTSNKNGFEMIRQIAQDNGQEVWFDTKRKVVRVFDKMGQNRGQLYSNELSLKELKKQSNTYDYFTVIYPYGKDGLNISEINGGKKYLSNYDYSNKQIEKVMVDENLEYAEDLLRWGQGLLDEYSQPKSSYQLSLMDIGDVGLGDTIMLVDKLKRIKQKQRVVKIVRWPFEPEKSTLDISNIQIDFSQQWEQEKKKWKDDIAYIKKVIGNLNQ